MWSLVPLDQKDPLDHPEVGVIMEVMVTMVHQVLQAHQDLLEGISTDLGNSTRLPTRRSLGGPPSGRTSCKPRWALPAPVVPLVMRDQWVLQALRVTEVSLEMEVIRALRETEDLLEQMDLLAEMVMRVRMVIPDLEDLLVSMVTEDLPVYPACPDQKDTEDSMVYLEVRACKVEQETVVSQDPQDPPA